MAIEKDAGNFSLVLMAPLREPAASEDLCLVLATPPRGAGRQHKDAPLTLGEPHAL